MAFLVSPLGKKQPQAIQAACSQVLCSVFKKVFCKMYIRICRGCPDEDRVHRRAEAGEFQKDMLQGEMYRLRECFLTRSRSTWEHILRKVVFTA